MASFSTTKQSVLDRINTLASNAATTAEESIYLSKALREAAFDQRFVWRGAWTQGLVYVAGDVAQYDGNAFVCTAVHTASSVFASDSAKWDTMVVGGAQWTTGSSVPANSVGEDGDWFYNTADETIHNKQGGSWTSIADLGGSRWTSSATVPANSAGEIGDFHMDTATQKIHEKTGATAWTELADLSPSANWDATSGNTGFISNKPTFKTVGGASIIGSGDITVADTQDLSISGQTLSLTDSPSVTLPATGGYVLREMYYFNLPLTSMTSTHQRDVNISGSNYFTVNCTDLNDLLEFSFVMNVRRGAASGYMGWAIQAALNTSFNSSYQRIFATGEHTWGNGSGTGDPYGFASGHLIRSVTQWNLGTGTNYFRMGGMTHSPSGNAAWGNDTSGGSSSKATFQLKYWEKV